MGRLQLNYGQSVSHSLGKEAFKYRVAKDEFRAVNVATLSWQLGSLTYTFSINSDPTSGDHSEERLLEIFDTMSGFDPDDAAKITSLALYTELAPCYTENRGPFVFPNPLNDPLIAKLTVKHSSCSKILRTRFPDLAIFFTVQSTNDLRDYIAFQSSWAKWEENTQTIILYVADRLNQEGKRRLFYRCSSDHMTFVDITTKLDLPKVLERASGICGLCKCKTVICGSNPLH